jgi:pyruvate dehydrogenase E1 component alpha subunit
MQNDIWSLYQFMLRSRLFEEAVAKLWHEGLISGEMHLGTGEEAIMAGIVSHLRDGDAIGLDHRGTAALLMRGVDPGLILNEILGRPEGLCGGKGGHMHMYTREHLIASSGIVGASGPCAAGFALAAQYLNPGAIAVAFFGEGAMNEGMLMESFNLASVWKLPVLFVCKDDGWSITTDSESMTGGSLQERAKGLGVPAVGEDGLDVMRVYETAKDAIDRARSGGGPTFLQLRCIHLEAHFLGYQMQRIVRSPLSEMPKVAVPLVKSTLKSGGANWYQRISGLKSVFSSVLSTMSDNRRDKKNDPIVRTRAALTSEPERLKELETTVESELSEVISSVFDEGDS